MDTLGVHLEQVGTIAVLAKRKLSLHNCPMPLGR